MISHNSKWRQFTHRTFHKMCTYFWITISLWEGINSPLVQSQVESYQRLKKIILDASLLNTQHYKVQIKSKWSNLGKIVAPFSIPWCSSNWKESLWVVLDYGQLTYLYLSTISDRVLVGPVSWGWRIHRLLLSREVRPPQRVS